MEPRMTNRLTMASDLAGAPVVDAEGQEVGMLHDLVVDAAMGRVAYALLRLRGGAAQRVVRPVPWSLVQPGAEGALVVDASPGVLLGAPAYQPGETPDWADREWGKRLHAHYQARPYWIDPAEAAD